MHDNSNTSGEQTETDAADRSNLDAHWMRRWLDSPNGRQVVEQMGSGDKTEPQCKKLRVYALMDGDAVFYVGVTKQSVMQRIHGHRVEAKSGGTRPVCQKIRAMEATGREIRWKVLQEDATKEDEQRWIVRLAKEGHALLNRLHMWLVAETDEPMIAIMEEIACAEKKPTENREKRLVQEKQQWEKERACLRAALGMVIADENCQYLKTDTMDLVRAALQPEAASGTMTPREAGQRGGKIRAAELGTKGYSEMGERGGATTRDRYGAQHYTRLGRASAAVRQARRGKIDEE